MENLRNMVIRCIVGTVIASTTLSVGTVEQAMAQGAHNGDGDQFISLSALPWPDAPSSVLSTRGRSGLDYLRNGAESQGCVSAAGLFRTWPGGFRQLPRRVACGTAGTNEPPATAAILPTRRLVPTDMLDVDVSQAFTDPDGDELVYTASSSTPQIVRARAGAAGEARVTLEALAEGTALIQVAATDRGGLSATQSFTTIVREGELFNIPLMRDGNRIVFGNGSLLPEAADEVSLEIQTAGDLSIWGGDYRRELAEIALNSHSNPWRWRNHSYFTLMLRFRMLKRESWPAAPTSFMPKWTIQAIGVKQESRSRLSLIAVNFVPFAHHSNGEDGCAFVGQDRVGDSCLSPVGYDSVRTNLNIEDGSFSTHYVQASVYYSWLWLENKSTGKADITVGVEGEHHLRGLPGELGQLKLRYGRNRVSAAFGVAANNIELPRRMNWLNLNRGEARYRVQKIFGITENSVVKIGEFLLYFERVPVFGLYLKFYRGRDYYNMRFEQTMRRFEMGIAFDWEGVTNVPAW